MNDQTEFDNWERKTLRELLFANLKEQRRKRRWSILFKLIYLAVFGYFLYSFLPTSEMSAHGLTKAHTALIDIRGPILSGGESSADNIGTAIKHAFEDKSTKGIILRINSPGGSPVQASYIYNTIQRLKKNHQQIKVHAVCTDLCASAAYYIAAAADDIYANESSLVGSIGVLFNGFGFVDTMKKIGVERRLYTAGTHKGFLDPFSPAKPSEVKDLQNMLKEIHKQFISDVEKGRGKRLQANQETFSGLIFTGMQAKKMGLIDGIASPGDVARDVIKEKNIIDYTIQPNYFERLVQKIGTTFGSAVISGVSNGLS